jgi:hypothetical protein
MNERIWMRRTKYSVLKKVSKEHECGWSRALRDGNPHGCQLSELVQQSTTVSPPWPSAPPLHSYSDFVQNDPLVIAEKR